MHFVLLGDKVNLQRTSTKVFCSLSQFFSYLSGPAGDHECNNLHLSATRYQVNLQTIL